MRHPAKRGDRLPARVDQIGIHVPPAVADAEDAVLRVQDDMGAVGNVKSGRHAKVS